MLRVERQVFFWLAAAFLLVLAIAMIKDVLLPFVAGIVLAYFLHPLVDRLVAMGLNRIAASALLVAGGAALIALLVLILPLLFSQMQQFAVALPGEIERGRDVIGVWARERLGDNFADFDAGLKQATETLSQNWTSLVGWAATSIWDQSLAIFNFVSLLLVTPLVVFYLLIDWEKMLSRIDSWLPRDHAPTLRVLAADINDAISAFIRGQGTVCLILALFYAVGLSAAGLNYGLLIGIVTGLLAFIPFVGWALGLITATGLAVVQFWPDYLPILGVVAVFLAAQAFDAGFLSPNIVGSKIGLHPVWLIFALFVFAYLFGFVGTLIAVPVAAAIGVLVRFGLNAYLESSLYRGEKGMLRPGFVRDPVK
jgi:predicted PurR-regulated permease PerM